MKGFWIYTILILSVFVFLPSINGDYLNWDDTTYITDNEILNKDIGITSFLELHEYDSYISLTLFSFQVQTKIFGNNPFYFHFFNILIHLINVLLVYLVSVKLLKNNQYAFLIALIFSIHPYRVESVAWIIQRKDLLYTMFFLCGILSYLKFLKTDKILWYLTTTILAYLAIMSKVAAISFVFTLLLFEYFVQTKITLKSLVLLFIIGFMQLSNINTVFFASAFSIIPLLVVRYFNKYSHGLIDSKAEKKDASVTKQKIITFFSYRRNYKISLYGFLVIFTSYFIVSLTQIIFMPEKKISYGFIFQTITYFLPVLIIYILDTQNYKRLSKQITNLVKSRKIIFAGALISVAMASTLYLLAKPHFEPGEFSISNIFSLKTLFYFSFSLIYYLFGFIIPFFQNGMYPYPEYGQYSLLMRLSPLILIIIGVALYYLIKKVKDENLQKNIIFGLIFFLINIVIVLHIIPIRGRVIVAERYSYLAYFGLIFILITILQNIYNRNKVIYKRIINISLLIIISSYAIQSYSRSKVFTNDYTFWSDVIEKNHKNHYAIFALGLSYFEKADYDTAIKFYNQAIELHSENYEYFLNRGSSYFKIGETQLALNDYNNAINLDSTQSLCYKNRGILHYNIGQPELALEDLQKAMQLGNKDKEVLDLYSQVDLICKQKTEFSETGNSGKELSDYYSEIAIKSFQSDNISESLRLYGEAIKYDSTNVDALKNRGNTYSYIKDFSNALNDYRAAILLSPADGGLYLNIANIQHQLGQVDSACTNWSIAVELGKSDANKMLDKYCK